MVEEQLRPRGISDPRVLDTFTRIDRSIFVPAGERMHAFEDGPLPIGFEQTISQPFIVALMTEQLEVESDMTVLDLGTGSGYQMAITLSLGARVFGIERIPELAARAARNLHEAGFAHPHLICGDGAQGWPLPRLRSPFFDRILVAAAAPRIPPPLVAQLRPGGRMILPVGASGAQTLVLVRKSLDDVITEEFIEHVRFVPLVGSSDSVTHRFPQG